MLNKVPTRRRNPLDLFVCCLPSSCPPRALLAPSSCPPRALLAPSSCPACALLVPLCPACMLIHAHESPRCRRATATRSTSSCGRTTNAQSGCAGAPPRPFTTPSGIGRQRRLAAVEGSFALMGPFCSHGALLLSWGPFALRGPFCSSGALLL